MKIGFVSPHTFTYPGGVQKHTLALKKEFEKKGHMVKIIFPRERIPQKKEKDTILVGGALYIPGNATRTSLSLNISPLAIWRTLKKEKFDLLHFQNFGVFLPYQILETACQISPSCLKILTFHALLDASWIFKEMPSLMNFFCRYILPKFDGVIAVSKPVLDQLKFRGPTEVIPNGVDINFFNPKGEVIEKFKIPNFKSQKKAKNPLLNPGVTPFPPSEGEDRWGRRMINILFVGRIEKRKGLIYLVKAFEILKKKYQNIRLIVIGSGPKEEEIQSYIQEKKIEDIFFEGKVLEEDLPKYYRSADICCFPSIYGEAFGIVLLEAMASQRPVVAFANQGYKEVLKGKGAQFLAKPKDINGLAKRLEILIKSSDLCQELGKWGRKEAEKYSWEKIAERTLRFYQEAKRFVRESEPER